MSPNDVVDINVTAQNHGGLTEGFDVTAYANTQTIGTQHIFLNSNSSTILQFAWNTTDFTKGEYNITAYATPIEGETEITDNLGLGGFVKIVVPGDINGNGVINIIDAILLGNSFGSKPGYSNWNPNADINSNNIVNILDAIILATHMGKTE